MTKADALRFLPLLWSVVAAAGNANGMMRSEREVVSVAADGVVSDHGVVKPHEHGVAEASMVQAKGVAKAVDADALGSVEAYLQSMDEATLSAHKAFRSSSAAAMDEAFDQQVSNPWAWQVDSGRISSYITDKVGDELPSWYAETDPDAMFTLLAEKLRMTPSNPPRKFYDLGSGFGKVASQAWLMGFDSTGVEISLERLGVACDHVKQLPHRPISLAEGASNHLRMVEGDASKLDFSDADVVFADTTMWNKNMLKAQGETASRMKPGSFVVTARDKTFPAANLKTVGELTMPSTWGAASKWAIQKVMPGKPAVLLERHNVTEADRRGVQKCQRRTVLAAP